MSTEAIEKPEKTPAANVIGIVGGGQLGCMLGDAADALGLTVTVSDTSPAAPARQFRSDFIVADTWPEAIEVVAGASDVITWDREDVPLATLDRFADQVPAKVALTQVQDRLQQKQTYDRLGLPTAPWLEVTGEQSVPAILQNLGLPVVLKARQGGFDGRGTLLVRTEAELLKQCKSLQKLALLLNNSFLSMMRQH